MLTSKLEAGLALITAALLVGSCSLVRHGTGDGIGVAGPEKAASRFESGTQRDTIDCYTRFTIRCA